MRSKVPSLRAALAIGMAGVVWLVGVSPVAATDVSPQGYAQSTESTEAFVGAPGAPRTMSSKFLPPGTYLLTAKGVFFANVHAKRSIKCNLSAPGPSDLTWTSIAPRSAVELMSHRITTITSNGAWVSWKCELYTGERGDVVGSWITLTAMSVGSFTAVDMDTGSRTTSGSAWPTVVSGLLGGSVDVPEIDDPQTIASLDLGRGTWVILAKATAKDYSVWPIEIDCRIKPIHDDAAIFPGPVGKGLDRGSLAWLGITTFTIPGSIDLICESSGSAGDSQISNIRITAIKVDDAYVRLLPPGATNTSSTQAFWHDAQRKACCTAYAKFDIPADSWLVMVTAQTYDPFDDAGGAVYCNLYLHTDYAHILDASMITVAPRNQPGSEGVLSLSAGISGGLFPDNFGGLEVACNTEVAGLYDGGRASSIRIVLLRVTGLNGEG